MKQTFLFAISIVVLCIAVQGQTKVFPAIKDYGAMFDVPFAKDKPDATMEYKIIAEAAMMNDKPDKVYEPFEHISRMYNLHVYSGIPQKNLHVEVVVFGPSVAVLLNNEAYREKYNVDNPNLKVIEQMEAAGIKVLACGQSVMLIGADPATVNANVDIVVSRFTTVSNRQMRGYVFFKF